MKIVNRLLVLLMILMTAYGLHPLWLPLVEDTLGNFKESETAQTLSDAVEATQKMLGSSGELEDADDSSTSEAASTTTEASEPGEALSYYNTSYGEELSGTAREFYNALVKNYVGTGSSQAFDITFYNPITFDPSKESGEGSLEEAKTEIQYALQNSIDAFRYDYPEVFWLYSASVNYRYTMSGVGDNYTSGTISTATVTPVAATMPDSGDSAADYISQFNAAVDQAEAELRNQIAEDAGRYTKAKTIHDYLCNKLYYSDSSETYVHTVIPAFLGDGGVVCEGYARAYKILCNRFDVPCICVCGTGITPDETGSHMWNAVEMEDGKWYLTDVTWDDQDDSIREQYLLTGTDSDGFYCKVSEDHIASGKFASSGMEFIYPEFSSTSYQ